MLVIPQINPWDKTNVYLTIPNGCDVSTRHNDVIEVMKHKNRLKKVHLLAVNKFNTGRVNIKNKKKNQTKFTS